MTLVATEHTDSKAPTGKASGTPRSHPILVAAVAIAVLIAAQYPSLAAGFWSWDWYWVDQHAQGNTAWGGPFYDLANHANPLPVEVQWYRMTLAVLGYQPLLHHVLTLAGLLATLAMLYLLLQRLGLPRWAGLWAAVLAGLAPASLTAWNWFAASPHMWAALLGLGAAVAHLSWRHRGSPAGLLAFAAPALTVLGLAMKNDAVVGPLIILAWEFSRGRAGRHPGRALVTAAAVVPVAAFVWWQATAIDPHRDTAQTGAWDVVTNALGLLRFSFLWQEESELLAEFPPAPAAPAALTNAGVLIGSTVLALAMASLFTRAGRILVVAGLASLGPVAVLQPALVSRYVLPPVLLLTAAAAAGAAHLARIHVKTSRRRAVLASLALVSVAVWGTLAHLATGAGTIATREEQALLSGLVAAGISPDERIAVQLAGSRLEPSTAAYRQYDPTLPPEQQLRGLTFVPAGQSPPPGMRLAIATRTPAGEYRVELVR